MALFVRQLIFCGIVCLTLSQNVITDKQGNRVIGQGNVWQGNKNSIKGQSNNVIGNNNQVTGSMNRIKGHNNVVGELSQEELTKLQQQMAAKLNARFGNIFGSPIIPTNNQQLDDPTSPQPQLPLIKQESQNKTTQISSLNQNQTEYSQDQDKQALKITVQLFQPSHQIGFSYIVKQNQGGLLFRTYGNWAGRPTLSSFSDVQGKSTWKCHRFGFCSEGRDLSFSSLYSQYDG